MISQIKKITILIAVFLFVITGVSFAHDWKRGHHKPPGHAYGHYKKGHGHHTDWHGPRHYHKRHYYHKEVHEKLSAYFKDVELSWLTKATRPL